MTGDPANVGSAPINLAFAILKSSFEGVLYEHHISSARMYHSFGFACRPGSIQDEEQIFGIHFLGWADGTGLFYFRLPPKVATVLHRRAGFYLFVDNHFLYGRATLQRLIDDSLQFNFFITAERTVSRQD